MSILPNPDGSHRIEKNALHIWPRGHFMIIALPNLDGSFTVTMFHPFGGEHGFNNLDTREKVKQFFETYFPSLIELAPHYIDEYFENPVGTLGTIKCYPWQAYGKTLIMGDASHAIVPFYGQGMNASFEDVVVFDEVLENHQGDWKATFTAYEKARKKDTDAIATLAIDNFHEMKDHVANPIFQEKRKLEMALEQTFPDTYSSKYSLVTFNENVGYNDAMLQGRAQDKAILNMIADGDLSMNVEKSEAELKLILEKVKKETQAILHDDRIAGLK